MNTQLNIINHIHLYIDHLNSSIALTNKLAEYKEHLNEEEFKDLNKIQELNNLLFAVNTVTLDSLVILKNYSTDAKETPYWERLFFVKSSCLIMHEFFSYYYKNTNKIVEAIADDSTFSNDYTNLTGNIKRFRKKYEKKLGQVRNLIAAHINNDWKNNFYLISTINNVEDGTMMLEFYELLTRIQALLIKLLLVIPSNELNLQELFLAKFDAFTDGPA